ncbi:MAG: hypothetical protein D6780_07100, partial [Candidatus Dadabacteria bacterium]
LIQRLKLKLIEHSLIFLILFNFLRKLYFPLSKYTFAKNSESLCFPFFFFFIKILKLSLKSNPLR